MIKTMVNLPLGYAIWFTCPRRPLCLAVGTYMIVFFQTRVVCSKLDIHVFISIFSELTLCLRNKYLTYLFQLGELSPPWLVQLQIHTIKKTTMSFVLKECHGLSTFTNVVLFFLGVCVAQPLVFLFAVFSPIVKQFFCPLSLEALHYLPFFELWLLTTPLVSSNFSCTMLPDIFSNLIHRTIMSFSLTACDSQLGTTFHPLIYPFIVSYLFSP